jgi:CBS domain containing-hemolysin-like protein
VADVRTAAIQSGHLRILVLGTEGIQPSVVHVRDTLLEPETRFAHELAREAFVLDAKTPVYEALARMRKSSIQLALVVSADRLLGVVTLADILKRVLPAASNT